MKKFKLGVFVIFCITIGAISISSCSTKENKVEKTAKKSLSNSKVESFEDFYKFFYSGRLNQISRISFPLKLIRPPMFDSEGYDTTFLARKDWSYAKTEYEVIKSRIEYSSKDKVIIVYYGIDPPNYEGELALGWYEEYIFELKNGKWFLMRIVDSST